VSHAGTLRLQVGARTLATIPRRLVRVGLSLDAALSGAMPVLPPLGDAHGYRITSLPETVAGPALLPDRMLRHVQQRYVRRWTDLTIGHDAWLAGLSANARSGLKRKGKKLAGEGRLDIRHYRDRAGIMDFHALARLLSATTYQEKLLDAGLPQDPAALLAAADRDALRAWLMLIEDRPIAYVCCTAEGTALRYDHVGHDPAWGAWSPGTVLHAQAMADLFAEGRFARFDFTEGDGQHKRLFSTGGVACVDLLLLRPSVANRGALGVLTGFDAAVGLAKRLTAAPALKRLADRVRR
jgi:hypothetical protein